MATLADLATRSPDRHPEATALRSAGDPGREYDYRRLRTDARKTGNFFAHKGIRHGRTLGVAADPVPETVLSVLAAGLLGAVVRLDPPREFEGRAVVAPADRVGAYELPAGGQRIGYGGPPEDPAVFHFEEEMWSENPTFPPSDAASDDPILATAEGSVTHREVLDAAEAVVEKLELRPGDVVALRAPLSVPGTVAAGVVAPLLSGSTVLLPDGDDPESEVGSVAVATADAPEGVTVDPTELP
jgi:non-ribosomal peptide synthetase component F